MTLKNYMNAHFFPRQSLKIRVTFFTLAIFVAGIWLLAFYASQMLRQDMQRLLGEQEFSTASFIDADVNEELDDRLRALEEVATSVSPAMMENTALLQTHLERRTIFQSLFNVGTFVTRPDGMATASTPLSTKRFGINYMDRDYIAAALNDGKATIGRPVMGGAVSFRIDRHRRQAEFLAGAHHADGDLPAVGDQDFLDACHGSRVYSNTARVEAG